MTEPNQQLGRCYDLLVSVLWRMRRQTFYLSQLVVRSELGRHVGNRRGRVCQAWGHRIARASQQSSPLGQSAGDVFTIAPPPKAVKQAVNEMPHRHATVLCSSSANGPTGFPHLWG